MKSNKEFDEVVQDMSLRYMIPKEVLLKIWKSQFEFARKIIENTDRSNPNNFKIIYFRRLGKLVPHKERLFMMRRHNELKKNGKG